MAVLWSKDWHLVETILDDVLTCQEHAYIPSRMSISLANLFAVSKTGENFTHGLLKNANDINHHLDRVH